MKREGPTAAFPKNMVIPDVYKRQDLTCTFGPLGRVHLLQVGPVLGVFQIGDPLQGCLLYTSTHRLARCGVDKGASGGYTKVVRGMRL